MLSDDAKRPSRELDPRAVALMFSGGMDSTLVACELLEAHQDVHLVTFRTVYNRVVSNSVTQASRLRERYGASRVHHHIQDIRDTHGSLVPDLGTDYVRYSDASAPGIVCLGCKLAMHARTALFCLEHRVPFAADGALRIQADHPECLPEVVNRLRRMYARYGVTYMNPAYEADSKQSIRAAIEERGFTLGVQVGQSSRTDQPVCLVGPFITMWKFIEPHDPIKMLAFLRDREAWFDDAVEAAAAARGLDASPMCALTEDDLVAHDVAPGIDYVQPEFGEPWDLLISWGMKPLWGLARAALKRQARTRRG
jgi:hypothetical protein